MERTTFDYSKLKGRIKEKCGSQKAFAERLGVTEATMTAKLNCDTYFTQGEILRSSGILEIQQDNLGKYFFTEKVQ